MKLILGSDRVIDNSKRTRVNNGRTKKSIIAKSIEGKIVSVKPTDKVDNNLVVAKIKYFSPEECNKLYERYSNRRLREHNEAYSR